MPDEQKETAASGKLPETQEELAQALGQAPPIEVKLATGQVYRGKTEKEVIDALVKAQEEATKAIRDREAQIRELKQIPGDTKPAEEMGEFSKERYFELMADDPMAALQYQLSHVMGVDPAIALETLRYAYQTSQAVDARLQNALFRESYPDAPYGDDFADIMIERMTEKRRTWNADNLGASYLELVHEGKVKPLKQESAASAAAEAPPPNPGKSSAGGEDFTANLERMSKSELESYLKKLGYL